VLSPDSPLVFYPGRLAIPRAQSDNHPVDNHPLIDLRSVMAALFLFDENKIDEPLKGQLSERRMH
jgi:hypothetical protein